MSNIGSVSVNNPISGFIGPNDSVLGTSTYITAQTDFDQGSVTNTSIASVDTIWNQLNVQVPQTFVSNQVNLITQAIDQTPQLGLVTNFPTTYD